MDRHKLSETQMPQLILNAFNAMQLRSLKMNDDRQAVVRISCTSLDEAATAPL